MPGRKVIAMPGEPACGAARKSGGTCDRPAGFGTDHVGVGSCRLHGGNLPSQLKAAAKYDLQYLINEADEMDPSEALLWCVSLAAQEVRWINSHIATVSEPTHMMPMQGTMSKDGPAFFMEDFDLWIKARQSAVDRLARYSKMALDAGVAERMVKMAEKMGDLIAPLLQGILNELNLSPAQQRAAPEIVGTHLKLLEAKVGTGQ